MQSIHLTPHIRHSLLWWTKQNLENLLALLPLGGVAIKSAASPQSWDAVCCQQLAQGRLSFPAEKLVSNIVEIQTAYQVLLSFRSLQTGEIGPVKTGQMSQQLPTSVVRKEPSRKLLGGDTTDGMAGTSEAPISSIYTRSAESKSGFPFQERDEWVLSSKVFHQILN